MWRLKQTKWPRCHCPQPSTSHIRDPAMRSTPSKHFGGPGRDSVLAPDCRCCAHRPCLSNKTPYSLRFRTVGAHSLTTCGDLYPDNTFLSLQQMCDQTQPTAAHTLLYYQLRATCKCNFPSFPTQPTSLPALEHILTVASGYKLITRLYRNMQQHFPVVTPAAREAWDRELAITITDKQWALGCQQLCLLTANYKFEAGPL